MTTGPTEPPAEIEDTVSCTQQPFTRQLSLSADPDGPPGVGGDDEGEYDEGEPPPIPQDPNATEVDPVSGPDLLSQGPGGVGGDPRLPFVYSQNAAPLITRGTAAEPNIATDGTNVIATWNWHAAASADGGRTFRGMDPETFTSSEEFCCDQLAHYVPARSMWVWVMQTDSRDPAHPDGARIPNHIRVAVAPGGAPLSESIDFTYWEWTPSAGGFFPTGTWLDRPKIGNTNEHLFIAVNAYRSKLVRDPEDQNKTKWTNEWQGALVIRMPLAALAAGTVVDARCHATRFQVVPISVATDTMYFGAHSTTSSLVVWRWPDATPAPESQLVKDVANGETAGYNGEGFSCPRDKRPATNWCENRTGARILTGWLSGGRIGFAWNAAQSTDPNSELKFPYVYSVFIDEASLTVVDHWLISQPDRAIQFPMLAPNARGDIGGVVIYGGGEGPVAGAVEHESRRGYPWCAAVVLDPTSGEWAWGTIGDLESTGDLPASGGQEGGPRIGDYLGVWPNPGENTWSGACMTYSALGTQVHLFRFGLPSDVPGA